MDGERDEVFFFVTERPTSIAELMKRLYVAPDEATRAHFLHVNAHIDPNRIRAGQLVVVTPARPSACTELEYAFAAMARDANGGQGAPESAAPEVVNRFYDLLNIVDGQAAGAVGAYATAYSYRVRRVGEILREIEELYVRTYNRHGRLHLQSFFQQRRALFERLDQALGQMVRSRLIDPRHTKMKRALGLSTRSTLNAWRRQGRPVSSIPEFHRHYERVSRLALHLRRLGYVGIGMDGYYSYRRIQEACTVDNPDPACTRRRFTETGRLIGSVGGGIGGGSLATYGICTVVFGLPTSGTSVIWCGVLAGGAGAFGVGMALGAFGEMIAEFVYERKYQVSPQ